MEVFQAVTSQVIPLDMSHVDTDMIIPAQFLTKINKNGYGEHVFQRLREQDADFVFNDPQYQNAQILLTRTNFGCGSSREHAVWAIVQAGVRVIIGESFSDIFYNNAAKNGLLLITLDSTDIDALFSENKPLTVTVNLADQLVSIDNGLQYHFEYDPFRKSCFLKGQDDLDYLLEATQ